MAMFDFLKDNPYSQYGRGEKLDRWKKSQRLAGHMTGDRGPGWDAWNWFWHRGVKPFFKAGTHFGSDSLEGTKYSVGGVGTRGQGEGMEGMAKTSAWYNPYTEAGADTKLTDSYGIGEKMETLGGGATPLGTFETGNDEWYSRWEDVLQDKEFTEEEIQRIKEGETLDAAATKTGRQWNTEELKKMYGTAELGSEIGGAGANREVRELHAKYAERGLDVTDPDSIAYHTAFNQYRANLPSGTPESIAGFANSPEYAQYKNSQSALRQRLIGAEVTEDEASKAGAGHYLAQAEQAMQPRLIQQMQRIQNIGSGGLAFNPFAERKKRQVLDDLSEMVESERGVMYDMSSEYLNKLVDELTSKMA